MTALTLKTTHFADGANVMPVLFDLQKLRFHLPACVVCYHLIV